MEILSTNYNCRNPFVAGFLPILDVKTEDEPDKSDKNFHILVTTSCSQSNLTTSLNNQIPTKIYQIDVSKVCTPGIYQPKLVVPKIVCSSTSSTNLINKKSKKALKNKRKKEAKRKRKNQRHVHFPEEEEMIAIIFVVEDDESIKEYRNKYWEFFAIDRNRFEHRVKKLSDVLDKILVPAHRDKIYKERFSGDEDDNKNDEESVSDSNNDSDLGIELNDKKLETKKITKKKRTSKRKTECDSNAESGFEPETESETESETEHSDDDKEDKEEDEDQVSLSITLSNSITSFHFYGST